MPRRFLAPDSCRLLLGGIGADNRDRGFGGSHRLGEIKHGINKTTKTGVVTDDSEITLHIIF